MEKNLKLFIIKLALLAAAIFLTRVLFQFPVEYYGLDVLKQGASTRLFNKVLALEVFVFVGIFFGLYYRDMISEISHSKTEVVKTVMFTVLGLIFVAAYYYVRYLANMELLDSIAAASFSFALLSASFMALVLAVFGTVYSFNLARALGKELLVALLVGIMFYNLLAFVQAQWPLFSGTISLMLYTIFARSYPVEYRLEDATPILSVGDFSVSIGAACSGLDSLFLFAAFFLCLFALDRRRVRNTPFLVFFFLGMMGVFMVNFVRLVLLILVGVMYSPDFAVGLFHTNAGWLLFIMYFLGYYALTRRFIYKKDSSGGLGPDVGE